MEKSRVNRPAFSLRQILNAHRTRRTPREQAKDAPIRCFHQLFEEPVDSLQAPFWYISMRSSTITCFRYSFKFGSRSFVDFGSNPVNSSNVEASSLDL